MNTNILRIATMTAFGKAFLQGEKVSYDKNHPAAYNYHAIKFVQDLPNDQAGWVQYLAENPNDWFQFLKKHGYTHLYLHFTQSNSELKDYISSAFKGGGSEWVIIAQKGELFDIWLEATQAKSGEAKIYFYIKEKDVEFSGIKITSLEETKLFLKEMLEDMVDFTIINNLTNWQYVFQNSINCLSIESEEDLLVEGFLPRGCYSLLAKQILAACDQAWIFGGMGSWNDVVEVDDYEKYKQLTETLYDTLCQAIVSAINSYP